MDGFTAIAALSLLMIAPQSQEMLFPENGSGSQPPVAFLSHTPHPESATPGTGRLIQDAVTSVATKPVLIRVRDRLAHRDFVACPMPLLTTGGATESSLSLAPRTAVLRV